MKKNRATLDLVIAAIFIGITLVLTLVPNLGYIPVGIASITIVHIPILIGIFVLPFYYGLALGLTFGLSSLLRAFMPGSLFDPLFQNPLISVLPRVLFAAAAFGLFHLIKAFAKTFDCASHTIDMVIVILVFLTLIFGFNYIAKNNRLSIIWFTILGQYLSCGIVLLYIAARIKYKKEFSPIVSSFVMSTIMHTILVLGALAIFKNEIMGDSGFIDFFIGILLTNGFIEAILAGIIGTPIYIAISKRFPELIERNKKLKEIADDSTV